MIELRVQTTPAIQPEVLQVRFDGPFPEKKHLTFLVKKLWIVSLAFIVIQMAFLVFQFCFFVFASF